jgi:hypothetical protein
MKRNINLLITILLLPALIAAQVNIQPKSAVNTGILYDLVVPVSGIEKYDGSKTSPAITARTWKQVYFELNKAALQAQDFQSRENIKSTTQHLLNDDIIPIGIQLYRYNHLNENLENYADDRDGLNFNGISIPEKTVFASVVLAAKTYIGSEVKFVLPGDLILTNFKILPHSYFIKFDEQGPWQPLFPDEILTHSYATTGQKVIGIKAVLPDGKEIFSSSFLNVLERLAPEPTATWLVTGEIPYQGEVRTGDAYVLLSEENEKLTRPVVISEGVDLAGDQDWDVIYEFMNQQNLIEDLRAQGFDVVVLNFHDNYTYIQRNAFVMVKLLQMVNDSIDYENPLVTVGASMGGLVVRYALTYMENNEMDHHCGLMVSLDAPNYGADMPLGLQYMLYFAKDLDAAIQELLDVLNGISPRQMLLYYYTDPPSATAGPDPLFNEFYSELQGLGDYPQNLRKIAVSNGSGHAIDQGYQAGDQVIDYNYSSFFINIKANVWAVEDGSTGQIMEGLASIPFVINEQADVSVYSEHPWDNSPGGYRATFAQIDSLEAPYGDIIALHDNHSYIPAISALDIDTDDPFYNIAADPAIMDKTPFDSIYWCSQNLEHVEIDPYLKGVLYDEIVGTITSTQTITLQAGWNDLSSYLDPQNKDVTSITDVLTNNMIILQNLTEVYWPIGGINTVGEWDYKSGYFIKLQEDASLDIEGSDPEDKTITFVEGWNLFPVLSKDEVAIATLFQNNLGDIVILKDAVGSKLFWPDAGVSSLETLEVGRAYLIKVESGFSIEF